MNLSDLAWVSEGHRRLHFARHRRELRVRSLQEYDSSARDTIELGTYFEYYDSRARRDRVGYYHAWTGRLTVLSADQSTIHSHFSHFRCPIRYIEGLTGSTYA